MAFVFQFLVNMNLNIELIACFPNYRVILVTETSGYWVGLENDCASSNILS